VDELCAMFEQNDISIAREDIKRIFQIVDDRKTGLLTEREFKRFILSA